MLLCNDCHRELQDTTTLMLDIEDEKHVISDSLQQQTQILIVRVNVLLLDYILRIIFLCM